MATTRLLLAFLFLAGTVACDSGQWLPTAPSGAAPSALTVLAIESFEIGPAFVNGSHVFYLPNLVLKETSGQSRAVLSRLAFDVPVVGSTLLAGPGCLQDPFVPAGGTWKIEQAYVYCREVEAPESLSEMSVTVSFTDEFGREGSVSARTTVK